MSGRNLIGAMAFVAAALAAAISHAADTSTLLDRYLGGLTSLRTSFVQTITDAHGQKADGGSGTLLVQRPGKFRWDYMPLAAGANGSQLLIADGRNLWFYDRELAQVTVKPEASSLSATPVMLLSGSIGQLHDVFDIGAGGAHDGLEWVIVTPRSAEADFSRAELGFNADQLLRMIVNDRLGQSVKLDFSGSVRNGRLDAAEFKFSVPSGVDLIGSPEP